MEKRRTMGRPAGRDYPVIKQVRLGTDDAEKLTAVAHAWRCSEAAAMRRMIQETALRVGVVEAETPPAEVAAARETFLRLLAKAQANAPRDLSPEELEREVTLASQEVREAAGAGRR